jgi:hypothetical protein
MVLEGLDENAFFENKSIHMHVYIYYDILSKLYKIL